MFGNKQQGRAMKKPVAIDKADIKAFLGSGSKFEGTLSFDEMVRLDGIFSGEINSSDTLIVGETAKIDAKINVGTLILSGKFKGDIVATTRVELCASAQVEGTIETPSLKIDSKVVFNGEIKMPGNKQQADIKETSKKQR